jgi:hypothetical protein
MSNATKKLLDREEVAEVLSGTFYARTPFAGETRASHLRPSDRPSAAKPAHYKVICISMYNEDLDKLDGMVEQLKARGMTKANRSALIRFALEQVDLAKAQKGF